MKKKSDYIVMLGTAILCASVIVGLVLYETPKRPETPGILQTFKTTQHISMLLLASSFQNNEAIPKKYTCDGGNINPELRIEGAPAETKSFALIMDDPDAPRGTFTHWVIWNIDPKTELIKEESVPPGSVEGKNDRGNSEYTGPCPPSGVHHYHFKLYALNVTLDLPAGSERTALEAQLGKHVIATAELVGTFSR